jgi:Golgi-resident PAP phosphatase
MNLGGSIKINKCALFLLIALAVLIIYIFVPSSISITKDIKSQSQVNLRKLVIGLILASRAGGKEVIKVSKQPDFEKKSKGKTKEGIDDPVTIADLDSHCRIANGLWRIFPQLNLISEEDVEKKNCPKNEEFFDLDPSVLGSVNLPENLNVPLNDGK